MGNIYLHVYLELCLFLIVVSTFIFNQCIQPHCCIAIGKEYNDTVMYYGHEYIFHVSSQQFIEDSITRYGPPFPNKWSINSCVVSFAVSNPSNTKYLFMNLSQDSYKQWSWIFTAEIQLKIAKYRNNSVYSVHCAQIRLRQVHGFAKHTTYNKQGSTSFWLGKAASVTDWEDPWVKEGASAIINWYTIPRSLQFIECFSTKGVTYNSRIQQSRNKSSILEILLR